MTKKILLALALTLGTTALIVPQASACGGYGAQTPETAVRAAVNEYVVRHIAAYQRNWINVNAIEGQTATATVHFSGSDGDPGSRRLTLEFRQAAWHVVSVDGAPVG